MNHPHAAESSGQPRRNIELKARIASLDAMREIAHRVATESLGVQIQTDTYFFCREGRLKLREIQQGESQLIWYQRSNCNEPRPSDYRIIPVSDPDGMRAALDGALGRRSVVRKRREIFLFQNVRIHLDDVSGIGQFIEFESVLEKNSDESLGFDQLAYLSKVFGIATSDIVDRSYDDISGT
jgi:predicted adenylyl cyclase CyaB